MSKFSLRAVCSLGAAVILGQFVGAAGAQTNASAIVLVRDSVVQTAGTIAEIDILANDQFPVGQEVSAIELIAQPQCGLVTAHADRVTYQAFPECGGPQIFYYGVAGSPAFAEVTVVVRPGAAEAAAQPTVTFGLARIDRAPSELTAPEPAPALPAAPAPAADAAAVALTAPSQPVAAPKLNAVPTAPPATGSALAADCEPVIATRSQRAALTEIAVAAPCFANTVAELRYSGIRLALPLDAGGNGALLVPGFEPVMPATLAFADGATSDFRLKFYEFTQIERMAVAWEVSADFELNALEFGAERGSAGHLDPVANPRSYDDIRHAGGGFMMTYAPIEGVGQSLQFYTHVDKPGSKAGIVRLVLDHHRSGLIACGAESPSEILVLVSSKGELTRTVRHRPTALGCAPSGLDQIMLGDLVGNVVIR